MKSNEVQGPGLTASFPPFRILERTIMSLTKRGDVRGALAFEESPEYYALYTVR